MVRNVRAVIESFWTRLVLSILCAALVFLMMNVFTGSSIRRISVDIESSVATLARIYYSSSAKYEYAERKKSAPQFLAKNSLQHLNFNLKNNIVRSIRIDPGEKPGIYKLYRIKPMSFFGKIKAIEPFRKDVEIISGPGTKVVKHDTFVEIVAENNDPWVIIKKQIRADGIVISPLIAAILTFFAVMSIRYKAIEKLSITDSFFWRETFSKKPSTGRNYPALDGLRGLAALFVLALHTGLPGIDYTGATGVVIFFSLSGYLLAMPFVAQPDRIMSAEYLRGYFVRRMLRIAPLYYLLLIVVYLIQGDVDSFLRSLFFLQGDSVYWAVCQEIHFYLMLPLIFLINHKILRDNKLVIILILFIVGFCFNNGIFRTYMVYGQDSMLQVYVGLFITGILFCYLQNLPAVRESRIVNKLVANPVVGLAALLALFGSNHLYALVNHGHYPPIAWVYRGNFNYLIGFLILAVVMNQGSLLAKILGWVPLRLVGTVSFSFYLLHPLFLRVINSSLVDFAGRHPSPTTNFILTAIVTFLISIFTYTYVERAVR